MKRIIFFLILVAGSARLEAHAFLKDADPGVGGTIQDITERGFEFDLQRISNPPLAAFRSSTRLGKRWTNAICIWIAPTTRCCTFLCRQLGAGTYKVVWRVVSVDTHVTNGNFTFRIVR